MKSISLEFDISLQVKFGFPQINYRRYPVFFDQHFHMRQFFRQLSVLSNCYSNDQWLLADNKISPFAIDKNWRRKTALLATI